MAALGQGLSYTIFASAMWPCVPLVVEKKYLGIAYGVAFSMQNVGLALFPLAIADIYNNSSDEYIPNVEYFFVGMAFLAVVTGFYLCYIDMRYCDSILNKFVVEADNAIDEDHTSGRYSSLANDALTADNDNAERVGERQTHPRQQGSFSSNCSAPEAILGSVTWH